MLQSTLVIVPTLRERALLEASLYRLAPELEAATKTGRLRWVTCGIGPVISGATTGKAIETWKPQQALLLGIAGGFHSRIEVGQAFITQRFWLEGIGAYRSQHILSPTELGWTCYAPADDEPDWNLESPMTLPHTPSFAGPRGDSLTVCAAAGSFEQAAARQQLDPQLLAEEMEGFSVAAACLCHQTPLAMIRGISNQAGDRDHRRWKLDEALHAVATLAAPPLLASLAD